MSGSDGFLTTHVLDTANGCPASGVEIELFWITGDKREQICSLTTNSDGRTVQPLIEKGALKQGQYELVFKIGQYFLQKGQGGEVPFIDEVPIRFGIEHADEHYHVPLLASPFSYSTYRGS